MAEPTIRKRKLTDYKPDPRNANRGSVRGQYMLDHSIEQVGAARSLVASADDYIPIGNHAQQALADAGITDVIEVETDGRTVVVVKRSDWESINDPDVRQAALLDNRTAEVSLTWSPEALLNEINAGVDLSAMFFDWEIDKVLGKAVENFDPMTEWEGMPEFENEPRAAKSLYVHFKTLDDFKSFCELINQDVSEGIKSIWHPKADRFDMNELRFTDEP